MAGHSVPITSEPIVIDPFREGKEVMIKLKKSITLFLLAFLLCSCADGKKSSRDVSTLLKGAVQTLGVQKGSPDLCVLTDATYVKLGGRTTETYVEMIERETGCSIGKGNLLFFQRPARHPLIVAVFNRATEDCVVVRTDGEKEGLVRLQMQREGVSKPEFWQKTRDGLSHADVFGLVTILSAWSLKAPYDFLKCAENHGHVCPGLAFGYFMAQTIEKKYPLGESEKYVFIATPNFCGDDAVSLILGLSAGKKNLIVKALTPAQKEEWSITKGAGILVKWKEWDKSGQGLVLAVDISRIREQTGFKKPVGGPEASAQAVLCLIPYLSGSKEFIRIIREFPVGHELMQELTGAGGNPYDLLGLVDKPVA
jgi:formylmethanofuran dehydrogenase subunit E-like metal-binding protein